MTAVEQVIGPAAPPGGWLPGQLRSEHAARWLARTPLDGVCEYALWPAGKLLRPTLVLESCAAVGGEPQQILPAALSLEYFHAASLVHDDIADGGTRRRGRPSVPLRFGLETALVAGDELVFQTFSACAECAGRGVPGHRVLAAIGLLAATGAELCRGQYMERDLCGDVDAGLDAYCTVAAAKTSALLIASCSVGAILGGGTDASVTALGHFGRELGIAFQMMDDLRPYAQQDAPDKDVLTDITGRKMTFPLIVARDEMGGHGRRVLADALSPGRAPEESFALLSSLLADPRAAGAARRIVAEQLDDAVLALEAVPAGSPRDRLAGLARAMMAGLGQAV